MYKVFSPHLNLPTYLPARRGRRPQNLPTYLPTYAAVDLRRSEKKRNAGHAQQTVPGYHGTFSFDTGVAVHKAVHKAVAKELNDALGFSAAVDPRGAPRD